MSDDKQKYANGSSLNASEMSKEEKVQAIEYWCEGNQQLKKILLYFNENNIETVGCCSGHEKDDNHPRGENAYMAITLGKKQDDRVIDLLAKAEEKKIDMEIAFRRGCGGKKFCILCSKDVRD